MVSGKRKKGEMRIKEWTRLSVKPKNRAMTQLTVQKLWTNKDLTKCHESSTSGSLKEARDQDAGKGCVINAITMTPGKASASLGIGLGMV